MDKLQRHLRRKDVGFVPEKAEEVMSPLLGDLPFSTAMRKEYPRAPEMARRLEQAEQAVLDAAGPAREQVGKVRVKGTSNQGRFFGGSAYGRGAFADADLTPEGLADVMGGDDMGLIQLSHLNPSTLAHEGRHALQFTPAASDPTEVINRQRRGMFGGAQDDLVRVPSESVTGLSPEDLADTTTIERDANRFVRGALPGIPYRESAITGAAQGTYEAGLNPELMARLQELRSELPYGKVHWGGADPIPTEAAVPTLRRAELRRQMEDKAETGLTDLFGDRSDMFVYDPRSYQSELNRANERVGDLQRRITSFEKSQYLQDRIPDLEIELAEQQARLGELQNIPPELKQRLDVLSNVGDVNESRYFDIETPGVFDQRYWRAATPEIAQYQADRHQAVVDTLRGAVDPQTAAIYDQYVRDQIANVDPRGAFLDPSVLKPPSMMDKAKALLSRSPEAPAPTPTPAALPAPDVPTPSATPDVGPAPEPNNPGRLSRARDYVRRRLSRLRGKGATPTMEPA
jgi:hypothetical protein